MPSVEASAYTTGNLSLLCFLVVGMYWGRALARPDGRYISCALVLGSILNLGRVVLVSNSSVSAQATVVAWNIIHELDTQLLFACVLVYSVYALVCVVHGLPTHDDVYAQTARTNKLRHRFAAECRRVPVVVVPLAGVLVGASVVASCMQTWVWYGVRDCLFVLQNAVAFALFRSLYHTAHDYSTVASLQWTQTRVTNLHAMEMARRIVTVTCVLVVGAMAWRIYYAMRYASDDVSSDSEFQLFDFFVWVQFGASVAIAWHVIGVASCCRAPTLFDTTPPSRRPREPVVIHDIVEAQSGESELESDTTELLVV